MTEYKEGWHELIPSRGTPFEWWPYDSVKFSTLGSIITGQISETKAVTQITQIVQGKLKLFLFANDVIIHIEMMGSTKIATLTGK